MDTWEDILSFLPLSDYDKETPLKMILEYIFGAISFILVFLAPIVIFAIGIRAWD